MLTRSDITILMQQVDVTKAYDLLEETKAGAVVKSGKAMDVGVYRLASDQASLHDF